MPRNLKCLDCFIFIKGPLLLIFLYCCNYIDAGYEGQTPPEIVKGQTVLLKICQGLIMALKKCNLELKSPVN